MSHSPSPIKSGSEVRIEARHRELHVSPTLVQEMSQGTPWHDIRALRPTLLDCCAYQVNGAVSLQLLSIALALHVRLILFCTPLESLEVELHVVIRLVNKQFGFEIWSARTTDCSEAGRRLRWVG